MTGIDEQFAEQLRQAAQALQEPQDEEPSAPPDELTSAFHQAMDDIRAIDPARERTRELNGLRNLVEQQRFAGITTEGGTTAPLLTPQPRPHTITEALVEAQLYRDAMPVPPRAIITDREYNLLGPELRQQIREYGEYDIGAAVYFVPDELRNTVTDELARTQPAPVTENANLEPTFRNALRTEWVTENTIVPFDYQFPLELPRSIEFPITPGQPYNEVAEYLVAAFEEIYRQVGETQQEVLEWAREIWEARQQDDAIRDRPTTTAIGREARIPIPRRDPHDERG